MTRCDDVQTGGRSSPLNLWIMIAVAAAWSCFRGDKKTRCSKRGFVPQVCGRGIDSWQRLPLARGTGRHSWQAAALPSHHPQQRRSKTVTRTHEPGRGAEQSGRRVTDQGQGTTSKMT